MIFFARPTRALVDDEPFVLFLAQTSPTNYPITLQLYPLNRPKQPGPRPVIPSACLAPARLAVIAGRNWPTRVRPLSRNPPPALRRRKPSRLWRLFSHLSALSRPSALTQGR